MTDVSVGHKALDLASQLPCKVTYAGVDWITCTAKRNGLGEALWAVGDTLMRENESEGHLPTRWQMKGYRGWSANHVAFGARPTDVLLQCSSLKARDKWRDAFTASENCSRIDLAVDVQFEPVEPRLTRDVYRQVLHVRPPTGRPCKSSLIISSDGGSTVYIGSRTSKLYARLYDKGVEQQTARPGQWFRFELEVKAERAVAVAAALQRVASEQQSVLSIVGRHFERVARVMLPSSSEVVICNDQLEPTTPDKQLHWLAVGVRPTVQQLCRVVGTARVLSALGFPQSVGQEFSL